MESTGLFYVSHNFPLFAMVEENIFNCNIESCVEMLSLNKRVK